MELSAWCVVYCERIGRAPRSTRSGSSAASGVYRREIVKGLQRNFMAIAECYRGDCDAIVKGLQRNFMAMSLIYLSEPAAIVSRL